MATCEPSCVAACRTLVHGRIVDRVHGLHDRLVVAVGVALDDVIRLLLEEPERQRGEHHAAAPADGQRQEVLAPFPCAQRLLFRVFVVLHGRGVYGWLSSNAMNRCAGFAPQHLR